MDLGAEIQDAVVDCGTRVRERLNIWKRRRARFEGERRDIDLPKRGAVLVVQRNIPSVPGRIVGNTVFHDGGRRNPEPIAFGTGFDEGRSVGRVDG